jgi:SAM-dependent methyltransferase
MGKQARRKGYRDDGLRAASDYLRRAGLPTRPDGSAYRRMAASDPEWFRRVCELDDESLALAENPGTDPARAAEVARAKYALLYRDLDTALAEYAARPVAIAHPWLRWWFEHHPPAARLLDLGCGPGVLTCAYALALPDAEVVGCDAVPEAVGCAQELARRLGASNANFVVADFTVSLPVDGDVDQIVAVTALGDGGLYPQRRAGDQEPFSFVADVSGPGRQFRSAVLEALTAPLTPGGWFLAFDRTPFPSQAVRLGAALLHAGVDVDLALAGTESIVEDGHAVTFTRFAGIRTGTRATTTAELARWLEAAKPHAYGQEWHQEMRFERLKAAGAQRVWGAEIDYSPHSPAIERREVWTQGAAAYGWITTSLGLRQLEPARSAEAIAAEYSAYARKWTASGLRVRLY